MVAMTVKAMRDLLRRVSEEEWELALDIETDPRWLTMPLGLRDRLISRHRALEKYDGVEDRSTRDAERLAATVGMKIDNFHRLYRIWHSNGRTPVAIAPYQTLKTERTTRLPDPGTADAVKALVDKALAQDPLAKPKTVIAFVKEHWDGPGKLPSDVTLRNFHDRAVSERRSMPGTLTINFSDSPQEKAVTATAFGEVVVIDHTAPARTLMVGKDCVTPTITLAIDLWSGMPLGKAITEGKPNAEAAVKALFDAERRLERICESRNKVSPRVLFASTFDREWDNFREWMLNHDFDLIERRDIKLHHGGPTKRIIGTRLGELQLQPRLAGKRSGKGGIDVDAFAVMNANDLGIVLDTAIDRMLTERFGELKAEIGVWLDLPPRDEFIPIDADTVMMKERRPRISIDRILERVRTTIGKDLIGSQIIEENNDGTELRIEVTIGDATARPARWLDLAEEAIAIRRENGITVQFDVEAAREAETPSDRDGRGSRFPRPRLRVRPDEEILT